MRSSSVAGIDLGQGHPIVVVPGVQGRWEWMAPAVHAIGRRARAISYSLCGDPGSGYEANGQTDFDFDDLTAQVDRVLDGLELERAALCGVSLGGLIALRYAASRPARISALVLVSTPGPSWRPDRLAARYVRHPVLFSPLFVALSPFRAGPEIFAAYPSLPSCTAFTVRHVARVLAAPMSPLRMSQRVRSACEVDFAAECARVQAPTLVITGEPHLDRVVPVEGTRQYIGAIPGARGATLERTGHLGLVTRPDAFADLVTGFVRDVTGKETIRS